MPEELLVQICDNRTARYSLGVFINTQTDLSSAQLAVQSFKNGSCLTTVETKPWQKITFLAPRLFLGNHSVAGNSTNSTRVNVLSDRFGRKLSARSDCTTAKVQSGDTCKLIPYCHVRDVKLGVHLKLYSASYYLLQQKDRNLR